MGKRGDESPAELDADKAFLGRLESLRLQAGLAMGLGDVSDKVIPKPVLVSTAKAGGTIQCVGLCRIIATAHWRLQAPLAWRPHV